MEPTDVVAITGLGAWSAVGPGVAAIRDALHAGRTGIRPVTRFDTAPFGAHLAGEVTEEPPGITSPDDRCAAYAVAAAREAWADAGLHGLDPSRIAVIVGSSSGGDGSEHLTTAIERDQPDLTANIKASTHHNTAAIAIAAAIGATGPRLTVSSACASGNMAIAAGADLLRTGRFDAVVVGGSDLLSWRRYAGFCALRVVSAAACAPFSHPIGMNLGEGAAFLVLETGRHAAARGAHVHGDVLGAGLSNDGFHPTAPQPTGAGIARALHAALTDADVAPDDVGYYNAHATGTDSNDAAESRALGLVFGDRAATLPVSGSKAFFGHTFGAAGPLEAVITLVAQADGVLPQTLHFAGPRADGVRDPIGQDQPRAGSFDVAISNNSAFGGANAAVVLGKRRATGASRRPRPVWIAGTGAVVDASGVVAELDVARAIRGVDPRDLDHLAAMVAIAATRATGGALRGKDRERTGLFLGTSRRPSAASGDFRASLDARGPAGASAAAFARTVMNAASGAATCAAGLHGPTMTWAVGRGSGLYALASAARWLALHHDTERIVAGGADERDKTLIGYDPERPSHRGGAFALGEGAACALLTTSPAAVRVHALVEAGPNDLLGALRAALVGAGPISAVFSSAAGPGDAAREDAAVAAVLGAIEQLATPAARWGYGDAFTGAVAFNDAVQAVQGGMPAAVVVHDDGLTAAIAAVLVRE